VRGIAEIQNHFISFIVAGDEQRGGGSGGGGPCLCISENAAFSYTHTHTHTYTRGTDIIGTKRINLSNAKFMAYSGKCDSVSIVYLSNLKWY